MLKKDKLLFALRFIVSFGLIITLLWIMRNDIGNIAKILKNSNKSLFIIALLINAPLAVFLSFRLKLLMKGQNIDLSIKDAIYLTFLGYFFNNFLPTAIGGDIVKAHYASKKTNNRLASYAAVLSDRLFGLIATLFIAVIGLVFIGRTLENSVVVYTVLLVAAGGGALTFFLLNKKITEQPDFSGKSGIISKIKEKIYRLYSAINLYRNNRRLLINIFLLSVLLQSACIVSIYFFILSLGGGIPLLKLFLVIPIIWTISMLPSLNGLGVREGAFVYFLKADIGADMGFAVSLLWLGVIIIYSVIGGVMHLVYPLKTEKGVKNDRQRPIGNTGMPCV